MINTTLWNEISRLRPSSRFSCVQINAQESFRFRYGLIRLRPNTLQLVGAKAGLATSQFRFDTPQVLPDGSASRAAGSFISRHGQKFRFWQKSPNFYRRILTAIYSCFGCRRNWNCANLTKQRVQRIKNGIDKNIDSNDKRFRKASCVELKRTPYIVSVIRGLGAFSLLDMKER